MNVLLRPPVLVVTQTLNEFGRVLCHSVISLFLPLEIHRTFQLVLPAAQLVVEMRRTQIQKNLFLPGLGLGIISHLSKQHYLGKAPPLRTEAGKGGSGRGEKEGRGGHEGVSPRRRGSAAAWVRGGVGNFKGSPYL